jgi:hypothetical protein
VPIDSLLAVRVAITALKGAVQHADTAYSVLEFTRHADGVTIYLAPVVPQGTLSGGGGGRVRVLNNGKATVLKRGI